MRSILLLGPLRVSFTSSAWLTARSPAFRLAQARSPFTGSRDPMTTRIPSCTSWRAISRPIPRLAPVTMAVFAMDICLLWATDLRVRLL